MALLYMDGFEHYTSATDMAIGQYLSTSANPCRWSASNALLNTTTFRTTQPGGTSKSLQMPGNTYFSCLKIPISTNLFAGFNFRVDSFPTSVGFFFFTTTADTRAATTGVQIYYNTDGSITCSRLNNGGILFTTLPNTIIANTWYYIELNVVFSLTGSIELKIEGLTVGSATGVDTKGGIAGAGYTYITYAGGFGGSTHFFDDIYVCDNTGTTNNTNLGPMNVYTLFPAAAGTTTTLTPVGAANNWDCVNETNVDNNTTYVQTSTAAEIDYYNVSNLPVTPTSVYGVNVGSMSCKGNYGSRYVRNKVKLGASIVNGATSDQLVYLNYRKMEDLLETKPGGGAWTAADVDAVEIGIEST